MNYYNGPCSDCGRVMSTHPDANVIRGTAYTDSRFQTKEGGAVYLVCEDDIKKRNDKGIDWAPGKMHFPDKINTVAK